MSKFASNKNAYGICDISGFRYKLKEMRMTWDGLMVGPDQFDPKHPQLDRRPVVLDAQALKNARPDRTETAVPHLLKTDSFKTGTAGTSAITVTEEAHGRSSSDTVRFYDVAGFDGITPTNVNRTAGYTITKVDADTYTFTVSTDTATTGNTTGGGFRSYAGPVTITP